MSGDLISWEVIIPFLRPIESLILDPDISDILVNGPHHVFIEKFGEMQLVPGVTVNEKSLQVAIRNIARQLGDDISEEKPHPRRPPARRFTGNGRHPAVFGQRHIPCHPEISEQALWTPRPRPHRNHRPRIITPAADGCGTSPEHPHLGRNRNRKDDAPKRPFAFHRGRRTHRRHRRYFRSSD